MLYSEQLKAMATWISYHEHDQSYENEHPRFEAVYNFTEGKFASVEQTNVNCERFRNGIISKQYANWTSSIKYFFQHNAMFSADVNLQAFVFHRVISSYFLV